MKNFISDIFSLGKYGKVQFSPGNINFSIDSLITEKVKLISNETDNSIDAFLFTVFNVLVYRYTFEDELVIDNISEIDGGNNIKVKSIKSFIHGENTFINCLKQIGNEFIKVPSSNIIKENYYNIVFEMHKEQDNQIKSEEFRYAIWLKINDSGKKIECSIGFNKNLFDKIVVERFSNHFLKLLQSVCYNPNLNISKLDMLVKDEKTQILHDFNDNNRKFPITKTVFQLLEEQVKKNPNKIAVKFGTEEISYDQLNKKSNRFARYLNKKGVGIETPVVIMLQRSIVMVDSILAIWKAGGAYVPVDVDYPEDRIRIILEESKSKLIITKSEYISESLEKEYGNRIIKLDTINELLLNESEDNLEFYMSSHNLAYTIFTSGSTGKPKGAMVEHVGMVNHIYAKVNELNLNDKSIIANNASHCFDISVWQIFSGLVVGGTTIIYPNDLTMNPSEFVSVVIEDKVSILELVPSFLEAVLEHLEHENAKFLELDYVVVTGEVLKPQLVKKWFNLIDNVKMVNAYGPTEASDDITHYVMDKYIETNSISIGKPIQNFNIYIVDKWMNICPVGVKGELCVAGIGVGRGYINNLQKTEEVFMEDPFSDEKGVRFYKTGDVGRWMLDGNIELFGRMDYQVKIRGYRIELGEIEAVLEEQDFIEQAIVVAREDIPGDKRIVAYYKCIDDCDTSHKDLKELLKQVLPEYMVPTAFVRLTKIPLNPNGKIDRKALPAPSFIRNDEKNYVSPYTQIQREIVEIWEKIFKITPIGIKDDFLELGGHSLLATLLVSRLTNHFNIKISLKEVLTRGRTVEKLAEIIGDILLEQVNSIELEELLKALDGLSQEEITALLESEA